MIVVVKVMTFNMVIELLSFIPGDFGPTQIYMSNIIHCATTQRSLWEPKIPPFLPYMYTIQLNNATNYI